MATDEPQPAPAEEPAAPPPGRRPTRIPWVWLVIGGAAVLGVLVGIGVALNGQSLGVGPNASPVARPTFVIGAATPSVVSPVPSPSPGLAAPASPAGAESTPTASVSEYVVEPGDTLRSIAQTVYGDAEEWPRIYAANRDQIGPNPDALQAGMRLQIP